MSFPKLLIADGSNFIIHSSSSAAAAEEPNCQCFNNNHPTLFPIGFNGGGNGTSPAPAVLPFVHIIRTVCYGHRWQPFPPQLLLGSQSSSKNPQTRLQVDINLYWHFVPNIMLYVKFIRK
jgi:hypothetical protein